MKDRLVGRYIESESERYRSDQKPLAPDEVVRREENKNLNFPFFICSRKHRE